MPRRRIIHAPGHIHFVTFSTYQRRKFLGPERARSIMAEVLQENLQSHHAKCHGFVIMPNHVHALIAVEENSTIGKFLKTWKKTSSYRIKRFFRNELQSYLDLCPSDCPIWQARFYDFNLESDDKVNEKLEYMHNNPAEAGLADKAIDWAWSSARLYEAGEVGVVDIAY